jgi:hypothetical protein
VNKQSVSQISNANNYLYVRSFVVCRKGKTNGWISQIKPIGAPLPIYNLTMNHEVNKAEISCTFKRNLRSRTLEELYDVDIIVETMDVHSNEGISMYVWAGAIPALAVLFASIVFAVVKMKNQRRKTIAKINHVNPLNQVPVIIPWTNQAKHWRLGETISSERNDFTPLQVRKSLLHN